MPNCKKITKFLLSMRSKELEVDAKYPVYNRYDRKLLVVDYFRTPGLIINDKIISSGRVPTLDEVKNFSSKPS